MKERLDVILVELGFFETRNKAQANILAGNVKLKDEPLTKAGEMYDKEIFARDFAPVLEIKTAPYVSRGGLKLKHAIKTFDINLKDKICIDIGASAGGFCDCMLQEGACQVWCVDVGYNQMDWKLKTDARVHNIEKTNARNCTFEDIFGAEKLPEEDMPVFLSMDLSFISIKKVLPNVLNFTAKNAQLVLLVKPQFEAQVNEVLKGGLIKDKKIHKRILDDIQEFSKALGLYPQGIVPSPITGNKSGNIEYLLYLTKGEI